MFTDLMIDMETCDTIATAALLSIGIVPFNLRTGQIATDHHLYLTIDLNGRPGPVHEGDPNRARRAGHRSTGGRPDRLPVHGPRQRAPAARSSTASNHHRSKGNRLMATTTRIYTVTDKDTGDARAAIEANMPAVPDVTRALKPYEISRMFVEKYRDGYAIQHSDAQRLDWYSRGVRDTEARFAASPQPAPLPERVPLLAQIAELTADNTRLEGLVYSPGLWRCAKCNFTLVQRNLNAHSGAVTARDQPGDKCPNCGVNLWRVTERENARENYDAAERLQIQLNDSKDRIAELESQLAEAKRQMESQKDEWLAWESKRTALEKDAERIDWMERTNQRGHYCGVFSGNILTRAAIDAAIARTQERG